MRIGRRVAQLLPPLLRNWLRRLYRRDLATGADLRACYRLILDREPDPEGWNHYQRLIRSGGITIRSLSFAFLSSLEFREKTARNTKDASALVSLPQFEIYVPVCDPDIGDIIRHDGRYESHVSAALSRHLRSDGVFVDVGANLGFFTLLGAKTVGPGGRVIAIEASQRNCVLIHSSVARNQYSNVEILPYAVSSRRGPIVYCPIGSNGAISRFDPAEPVPTGGDVLYAVTLDDLLEGYSRIDVVKMDIEGGEYAALVGASRLLERCRPLLLLEYSPGPMRAISGASTDDLIAVLAEYHYEISVLSSAEDGEAAPLSDAKALLKVYDESGQSHLDLMAVPRLEERRQA